MKIGLVLPVYISNETLLNFLPELTKSIKTKEEFIFILVENYIAPEIPDITPYLQFNQEPQQIIRIKPKGQQSVARGWNLGIKEAIKQKCDYIAVLNLDSKLSDGCLDSLVYFGETHDENYPLWFANAILDENLKRLNLNRTIGNPDYACFMVRSNFMKQMKGFDENYFPYGNDDWDMHVRIENMGLKAWRVLYAEYYHAGSQTIATDKDFAKDISPTKNGDLFFKKWGDFPGKWNKNAYYKTPYNDPNLGINDWSVK